MDTSDHSLARKGKDIAGAMGGLTLGGGYDPTLGDGYDTPPEGKYDEGDRRANWRNEEGIDLKYIELQTLFADVSNNGGSTSIKLQPFCATYSSTIFVDTIFADMSCVNIPDRP
jgi:hypothetical protein